MTRNSITKILDGDFLRFMGKIKLVPFWGNEGNLNLNFTLILKALLNPEAKNPPKGPITELKTLRDNEWSTKGGTDSVN